MNIKIYWGGGPDLDGPALLGMDVEGKQRGCRLVQLGYGEEAWLYDTSDPSHLADLRHYLDNPAIHFVSHSRYDQDAIYWTFGIDLTGRMRDSFLLACLVFPGEHNPHGLKPLSTRLIDGDLEAAEKALHAKFKEVYGGNQGHYLERGYHKMDIHTPEYELYSGMDAVYCLKLYHVLKQAHDDGVRDAMHVTSEVFFHEQEISDIMGEASRRGMKVDRERAQHLLDEAQDSLATANGRVKELTGFPARSVKVGQWLQNEGVEFPELTPAGRPKLDKAALKVLVPRYQGTKAGEVLEARQLASKNSNRVANAQNFLLYSEEDGAVHPDVKTAIASTGRMSITNPAMQTLAKGDGETGLRSVFVARPGYVLIAADFANQELRVAAALSGDHKLAQTLLDGIDLHNVATESVFGAGSWQDSKKRAIGKVLNFAALYGAGPKAISKQTGLSYEEAREALNLWWAGWPALQAWNERNKKLAEAGEGWVILDSGRMIPAEPGRSYALTNYLVQGSARDVTCQAIVTYARLMPGSLLTAIHDEILAEVPEERAEEGLAALNEAMNFTYFSQTQPSAIPMPISAQAEVIGERWTKN